MDQLTRKSAGKTTAQPEKLFDLSLIFLLLALALVVVNPIGNFPLNDDWSYARTTFDFVRTLNFMPLGWVSMPLISNVLWGGLFVKLFGASFTVLRFSTLIASGIGLVGIYMLAHALEVRRTVRVGLTLTLAFNPLFFALSNTYMTDAVFTVLIIWASFAFTLSLQSQNSFGYWFGILLSVLAVLSRQLGLAIPIAFTVAQIYKSGFKRYNLARALLPPLAGVACLLVFQVWLRETGRLPSLYYDADGRLLYSLSHAKILLENTIAYSTSACLYLGLFLSPLFLLGVTTKIERGIPRGIILIVLLAVLAAWYLLRHKILMPLGGDVIIEQGIGPLALRDILFLHLRHVPSIGWPFWLLVTILSIFAASELIRQLLGLFQTLLRQRWPLESNANATPVVFLLVAAFIQVPPLVAVGYIDRYLLPLVPLLAVSLAAGAALAPPVQRSARPARTRVAAGLLVAFAGVLYATMGTKDYLEWNRVRWHALHWLESKRGVGPAAIDGGFEYNGLFLYDPNYKALPGRSWWWVHGDKYEIAFGAVPGYRVLRTFSYRRYLPPRVGKIEILEATRKSDNGSATRLPEVK